MRHEAYIGLGANIGNCAANLRTAIDMMRPFAQEIRVSGLYRTSPVGFRSQPAFYNAACRIWTHISPYELMERMLGIEAAVGRQRAFLNAPRILDIDILLYDRRALWSPPLTLPHPQMHLRRFVLLPLADIAPRLTHPVNGLTVGEMLNRLTSQSESVERVAWD